MFSVYHDQKDGSEFSDVTLASEDDNDNSDLNECDQEVEKTPIEDYGQDVRVLSTSLSHSIKFELSLSSSEAEVTSKNSLPSFWTCYTAKHLADLLLYFCF